MRARLRRCSRASATRTMLTSCTATRCRVSAATVASCRYGAAFSACVAWRNFYGVQFHPERSAAVGARVCCSNFLSICEHAPAMRLIPAIDLKGGRCVRLLRGRFCGRDALRRRAPRALLAQVSRLRAPIGCMSSTSTARATAARGNRGVIAELAARVERQAASGRRPARHRGGRAAARRGRRARRRSAARR